MDKFVSYQSLIHQDCLEYQEYLESNEIMQCEGGVGGQEIHSPVYGVHFLVAVKAIQMTCGASNDIVGCSGEVML